MKQLKEMAGQILAFFENTSNGARERLAGSTTAVTLVDSGVLAPINTMTDYRAVQNLAQITSGIGSELKLLVTEPAIARIVVKEEGKEEHTIFITRGGTLPVGGAARMASYRSPMGRLASLRVGQDEEVRTPNGILNYELREHATLRPTFKLNEWDSPNTQLRGVEHKPITIVSLKQLLEKEAPQGADYLDSLLAESRAADNVLQGIRRDVRKKMGLRDQPLLNEIQDNIFRMPLASRLIVLGPPGTGKTTTLIKRLGLKLDSKYLEDNEKKIIDRTMAGPNKHSQSWLMFTPTELLRHYVKEAFAREEIPASDERIKTWADYSRDVARNKLGILRTDTNNGPFILRAALESLHPIAMVQQTKWFEDFENWQAAEFWKELAGYAERLVANSDQKIAQLGKRLATITDGSASPADKFIGIAAISEELQNLINSLHSLTDERIRNGLGQLFKQQPDMIRRLMQFVATLEDDAEELDDPELEEDEDHRRPADRGAAIDACIRAVRSSARAAATGRALTKGTIHGRLVEFLGGQVLSLEDLKSVGLNLQVQTAARRLISPLARFISGVPRRYRRFRRVRQSEGIWYSASKFAVADIAPLEADAVLLTMLRATRLLLGNIRIATDIDHNRYAVLKTVQELFKNQIVVDEATDFSPIQLACMAALCDPAVNSFFACGDFNQRITMWGTRSVNDLKWAVSSAAIQEINISYRHTHQLNDLAHRIALLSNPAAKKTALPEDVINDGVKPVLAEKLSNLQTVTQWLAARIGEIERLTGEMPSIAVLVNSEDEVEPLAKALDAELAERSIRAVACVQGQTVGQDNDVRVFDVQHIKGLEFEAVFFVAIDNLAKQLPELFDKYLYVGTTRAATFLGLTTQSTPLPENIREMKTLFQEQWPS